MFLQTVQYRVVDQERVNGAANIVNYMGPRQIIHARNQIHGLPKTIELFYQCCINVRAICCEVAPPSRNYVVIGALVAGRHGERKLVELSRRAYLYFQIDSIFDIGYSSELWFQRWINAQTYKTNDLINPVTLNNYSFDAFQIKMCVSNK